MTPEEPRPNADPPPADSPIEALEKKIGLRLDAIHKARAKTRELLDELSSVLADIDDSNCAVVVTGSLGRGEASSNSDADWFLLVDGPSNPDHARMAREIEQRTHEILETPHGSTRTFGEIVASHELVHYIAGTRDTNENLTRRILLLAESRAITRPAVRERVIRNVLARYVKHEPSVRSKSGRRQRIPHFLLNDVVRYWRTMASDFASKMWEQARDKWAIRNIKLRFSRKLLFVWGLLASFSGELVDPGPLEEARTDEEFLALLSDLIREQTEVTPLELLARISADESVKEETARTIFSAYDSFLAALCDPATRNHLKSVRFEEAADDEVFHRLRTLSKDFRFSINDLFFDQHPKLKKLIRDYGVF